MAQQELVGYEANDVLRYNRRDLSGSRGVAQPGSAPALGAGGPRFKSARPDQYFHHRRQHESFRLERLST